MAAPEHGSWPGNGYGGPAGKGLAPTVPWGLGGRKGGRAWLDQPHTSAPAPSGLPFKSTCWGNNKDNVAQINALDLYQNGCWEPAPCLGVAPEGFAPPASFSFSLAEPCNYAPCLKHCPRCAVHALMPQTPWPVPPGSASSCHALPIPCWVVPHPGELQLHPSRKPQDMGRGCSGTLGTVFPFPSAGLTL